MFPLLSNVNFLESLGSLGHFLIFVIISLIILLYVLFSVGLQTMAQKREMDYPWLAWFPVLRFYLIGELVNEKMVLGPWTISYVQVIIPILSIVTLFSILLPWIGWIAAVLYIILSYTLAYRFCKLYNRIHASAMLFFAILFPVLLKLYPFILRKHQCNEYL